MFEAWKHETYEAWCETVHRQEYEYEEHPEEGVLQGIRQTHQTGSMLLILGEPGAGKSTLLEMWLRRWSTELAAPHLGIMVPVLVHLKDLTDSDVRLDSGPLAERLWNLGVEFHVWLNESAKNIYRGNQSRYYNLTWFLDGLDEIANHLLDEHFYRKLANLSGLKVLTCRTAVFESLRRVAGRYNKLEYELLGLKPKEQRGFLGKALDAARADNLHKRIQNNIQIRWLASNPMMLDIIAKGFGDKQLLPTRAEFYQASIEDMWQRRLRHYPDLIDKTALRDSVLTELASSMGIEAQAPKSLLEGIARTFSIESFRTSGLLKIAKTKVEFLHLTFQEYYLASALQKDGLQSALKQHWDDARYEETLALLVSKVFHTGQYQEIDQGICWLVKWGKEAHRKDRALFWDKCRSPLRVVLHVLHRAGIVANELPQFSALIRKELEQSELLKVAVGSDPKVPLDILVHLASDNNPKVRSEVAKNPSSFHDVLAQLATDEEQEVREAVGRNRSTPPEVLSQLAGHEESDVRSAVAWNPSTSPEVLGQLAADHCILGGPEHAMYRALLTNPSTPPEVLDQLISRSSDPKKCEAENPRTPPEVLKELARDANAEVRCGVAENGKTAPEVLKQLAGDGNLEVRCGVAENRKSPLEVLKELARDGNLEVRCAVAKNPSTPPEVLSKLAEEQVGDENEPLSSYRFVKVVGEVSVPIQEVRCAVAKNPRTPPEVLGKLAGDEDEDVVTSLIDNPNLPSDIWPQLDEKFARIPLGYRSYESSFTSNPNTPPITLMKMALFFRYQWFEMFYGMDPDSYYIRSAIAAHSSTPPPALVYLVSGLDYKSHQAISSEAAINGNILLEDLYYQNVRRIKRRWRAAIAWRIALAVGVVIAVVVAIAVAVYFLWRVITS